MKLIPILVTNANNLPGLRAFEAVQGIVDWEVPL